MCVRKLFGFMRDIYTPQEKGGKAEKEVGGGEDVRESEVQGGGCE